MSPVSAFPAGQVRCPACQSFIDGTWLGDAWTPGEERVAICPRCSTHLDVTPLPALRAAPPLPARTGEDALEGEATCYFHPAKRAERPCDQCGRFLCALCDLSVGARHLCPACLARPAEERPVMELVARRTVWASVALHMTVVPLIPIFWMVLPFTAPVALFLALYGWGKPGSLLHGRRHFTAACALILATLEIGAVAYLIYRAWEDRHA